MERRKSRAMFRHTFLMQFLSGIMKGRASTTGIDKTQSLQMGGKNKTGNQIFKERRDGTGLSVTLHSNEKKFSA